MGTALAEGLQGAFLWWTMARVRHSWQASLTVLATLQVKSAKPGILSKDLRESLGMGESTPPPWLINMQRYGPPPSYPDLKIAGLNAPIPPNARFGYQPGGWGKPPVDENGEPLYGDVFGQYIDESDDEQVCFESHTLLVFRECQPYESHRRPVSSSLHGSRNWACIQVKQVAVRVLAEAFGEIFKFNCGPQGECSTSELFGNYGLVPSSRLTILFEESS